MSAATIIRSVDFAIAAGDAVLTLGITALGIAGVFAFAASAWRRR